MSEIEKMYENAGVKPGHYRCEGCEYDYEDICPDDCPNSQAIYPSFTAEKQIELIKWLVRHRFNFMVFELRDNDFTFEVINKRLKPTSQFVSLSENNFEEGLAKVLNCFWQDLTDEEKQQVKGILE